MMNEVEFLPERIRQQRARKRRLVRQGYLLAACGVALGMLTYVNALRIDRARAEKIALDERATHLSRQISMIPPLEQELAELLIKQRIEAELGSRADCTAVLAELCQIMPPNMVLTSLELKAVDFQVVDGGSTHRSARPVAAPAPAKASRTERRIRMVITGLAPTDVDVANFIGQLSASCVFEDVNMGYAKTRQFQDRLAREFQASCNLAR